MSAGRSPRELESPLSGTTVIDVTRMLPGAVLARMLLELGAGLIKVETPHAGDPLRSLAPQVDGIGAGFREFYRGAESICLDLATERGAERLRGLCDHADVLVESFRAGTLERWGVGPERLLASHPGLVVCSLAGFGRDAPAAGQVGHDINFVAASGLLSRLSEAGEMPRVQLADVTAALLACSAVLAALLRRERGGRGGHVEQPLSTGPLPFLTLAVADAAVSRGESEADRLLSGGCPAYRLYRCGDGPGIAVGALEPKFWQSFVEMLELPELSGAGLDSGPAGVDAARQVQARLDTCPREHWLELAGRLGLPVTPVDDPALPPGGPGPYLPALGRTPRGRAPRLGEHTDAVLARHGIR